MNPEVLKINPEVLNIKMVKPKAEPKPRKLNRDDRRNMKRIASKMLLQSHAYIIVMWNGIENEEPLCIMDITCLDKKETIIAKVFGKIAQHAAACLKYCIAQMGMTAAERANSDLAAKIKAQRSQELRDELAGEDAGESEE